MPSKIHNLETELGRAPEVIKITSVVFAATCSEPFESMRSEDRKLLQLWRSRRPAPGRCVLWTENTERAAQVVRPQEKSCHAMKGPFIFCCNTKLNSLATWWWFQGIVLASCLPVPVVAILLSVLPAEASVGRAREKKPGGSSDLSLAL